MEDKKINWFEIDLEAFQGQYDLYVAAVRACDEAERQMEACEGGTCTHERPLRKDGKPDRRYPCPVGIKVTCRTSMPAMTSTCNTTPTFGRPLGLG